jgi:hypothetical protein
VIDVREDEKTLSFGRLTADLDEGIRRFPLFWSIDYLP